MNDGANMMLVLMVIEDEYTVCYDDGANDDGTNGY